MSNKRKAIVIGASSGIGLELAKHLSAEGWAVGLAARRVETLEELLKVLPSGGCAVKLDVTEAAAVPPAMDKLAAGLGGVDACFICAGVDYFTRELDWGETAHSIAVNVTGFAAAANHAFALMSEKGGTLVGITSIAALRGSPSHPAYCATKAFQANYLEGLRARAKKRKIPVTVMDARPGYVDTPMSAGQPGKFWELSPAAAARAIYGHAMRGKPITYLNARWRVVAAVMRNLPESIFAKM